MSTQKIADSISQMLQAVAAMYFCASVVFVAALFLSFGTSAIPSVALRIAFGLLAGHGVVVVWSRYKGLRATWSPFLVSLVSVVCFLMVYGAIAATQGGIEASCVDTVVCRVTDAARLVVVHGVPVLLPLMGVLRTFVQIAPDGGG